MKEALIRKPGALRSKRRVVEAAIKRGITDRNTLAKIMLRAEKTKKTYRVRIDASYRRDIKKMKHLLKKILFDLRKKGLSI